MDTLELDQPVPSQQTLVANKEDQRSVSSEEHIVGDGGRLFEVSVKHADENGIKSLSDSGRKMRGRKSKDSIFTNGVEDSANKKAKRSNIEVEEEDEEEEDVEEGMLGEGNEFSVGDFVWAKIKSYPWWPGQIYSPSDASATAAKYKRRDRLLVACFGDKTFAWCYPFQLKPFQENFDHLVKEGSSKSFSIAVEEAVNEIGRRLDVEMACSCSAMGDAPLKPVAVALNAGIKVGVAVPDGDIGELSINHFDPVKFLASIKCVAENVSVYNVLELLVLRSYLSGFYRTKGYYHLPEYHEPMKFFVSDDPVDKDEEQIKNVTGTTEEADWFTESAVPEVGSTGITVSRRLSTMSEDKLLQSKKQRSVADLMAEEKEGNVSAKQRGRPKKKEDNTSSEVGSDVAEELITSGKEASLGEEGTKTPRARGRTKKRSENTGSEGGKDVAEELSVAGKDDLSYDEGAVSAKASGRPKKKIENVDLNMDAEIESDVAEELTISGKEGSLAEEGTGSAKKRGRPKKIRENLAEVGSDVAEEVINSSKTASLAEEGTISAKPRSRPKKTEGNANSKGGVDITERSTTVRGNAAEELAVSDKQASLAEEGTMSAKPRGRPKKTEGNKDSKGGVDITEGSAIVRGNAAEELSVSDKQAPLAEEGTTSARPRGRPKKTGKDTGTEGGTDAATEVIKGGSDVAEEMTISGKQSPLAEEGTMSTKPRGRPKKTKENTGSEGVTGDATELVKVRNGAAKEMTISGIQPPLAEEGTTAAKPRGRPRKKMQNESDVKDGIDVVKQLPFSDKQSADSKKWKRNKDSVVGKDRGGDGELSEKQMAASGIRIKKMDSELENNSALVQEGSVNGEHALTLNKALSVNKDDLSTEEKSNSSSSLRERKKSKYLSPPYTLLSKWKKNGILDTDSKKKTSNISSKPIEGDSGARDTSPPIVSPSTIKSSGETFQRELSMESSPNFGTSGSLNILQPNERHNSGESYESAHEILSDFRSAALDPSTKKKSDDSIKDFFTKFRTSSYQEVSDFTVHNNQFSGQGSRKRVSFEMKSELPNNAESENGHPISEGESERKKSKMKEGELSPMTSKHVDTSVAVLLITFTSGASLPSRHELIRTFSPYGALKESETEIIEDSSCAQVVFASRSDAEEAYKHSDQISSLGSSVVSYRLRYIPVSKALNNVERPHLDHPSSSASVNVGNAAVVQSGQVSETPPLQFVKHNLQMATSALESSWDKLSSDVKASLDTEIKGFLSKVTSMVRPSS